MTTTPATIPTNNALGLRPWMPVREAPTGETLSAQAGQAREADALAAYYGDIAPERIAQALAAASRGDVRESMMLFEALEDRDGELQAHMRDRRMAAAAVPAQLNAADRPDLSESDRRLAEEIAEDCRDLMRRRYGRRTRQELFDGIGKGASLLDIPWVVRDRGRVDIADEGLQRIEAGSLAFRGGQMRLLTEGASYDGEELTPWRYVRHIHPGRPGRAGATGLLRPVAGLWMMKRFGLRDWLIFCDLFGTPIRIGRHKASATAEEKAALLTMLKNLGLASYGIFSEGTGVEFVETAKGGKGTLPYEGMLDRIDRALTICVKGQTGTTDVADAGAYAAAKVLGGVRQDLAEDDAEIGMQSILRDLVAPYVAWNYGRADLVPTAECGWTESEDLVPLAQVYRTAVVELGLPVSAQHVYQRFGIEPPGDDEELLVPPQAQQTGGAPMLPF